MSTNAMKESKVDVLIIGAGPAGVMACNALAKNGVNVRVVDQRPIKVAAGQADGIQPRTIEVLQSYGLADRLLREGNQMHMAAFYNPSPKGGIELTDRVADVTSPTARYPFEVTPVTLHQGAIEAIFLDSMQGFGVEVDRPMVPTALQLSQDLRILEDPQSYPVQVTLRNTGTSDVQVDTEIVHAKFVIGADGAHSWVRKSLNIAMEGEQTDYIWGVVDFTPVTDFPDIRNRCAIHSNNGSCMIIPREGDLVRLYIQLGDKDFVDSSGRVDRSKVGPHQLLEVANRSLHPYSIETPESFHWWTIYIIGQRVASKFSVNERVFIVGDACHTHSPKAGLGMNASMNDSHNLAWKLTHVLRGWAGFPLLKTYEFERRKFAQDLINFDKQFAKLFSGKPRTEHNQDGVSHEEFFKIFQTFGGFTSGIGIHYNSSIITNTSHQSYARNLTVGERMPPQKFLRAADYRPVELQDLLPSDARFKILVFAGDTSDAAQLSKVEVHAEELADLLEKLAPGPDIFSAFDILSISSAAKSNVRYNDLPKRLRSHWSKVLIDDDDVRGAPEVSRGNGCRNYGIATTGAIIIVRPDGYVGMTAALHEVKDVGNYLGSFMKAAE
ncbi:FAD binding domain-containing protein [Crassisporium funariophilum]|nr:FAD binding domain-containing protein [Crassisporium funariophilum]